MSLLVGMKDPKKVSDTAKCLDVKLSEEDAGNMEELIRDIQVEVLDK